jgi:hypothetical protein
MAEVIRKDDEERWQKLYDMWIASGKPGYVVIGGTNYRVLIPDEDNIAFEVKSGFDTHYGSQSRGL